MQINDKRLTLDVAGDIESAPGLRRPQDTGVDRNTVGRIVRAPATAAMGPGVAVHGEADQYRPLKERGSMPGRGAHVVGWGKG